MTAQTDATPNSRRSPMEHDRDMPDDAREGMAELARLGQQMDAQTDAPKLQRFSPYAVDGGCDAYGQMEEDDFGDYYNREDANAELDAAQAEIAKLRGRVIQWETLAKEAVQSCVRLTEENNVLTTEKHADAEAIGALREALEFYADQNDGKYLVTVNHIYQGQKVTTGKVLTDNGATARAALATEAQP